MSEATIAIPLIIVALGLVTTLVMTIRNVRRGRTPIELLGGASISLMITSVMQAAGVLGALALITVTNDRPIPIIDRIRRLPAEGLTVFAWACWAIAAMALIRQHRTSSNEQRAPGRRPWFVLVLIACLVAALQWTQGKISEIVADARHAIYYEESQIAFRAVTEPKPGKPSSAFAVDGPTSVFLPAPVCNGRLRKCALLDNGAVRCFAESAPGEFREQSLPIGNGIRAMTPAFGCIGCFVETTGHVRCLMQGLGGEMLSNDVEGIVDAVAIASSLEHACAIERDGRLFCWDLDAQTRLAHENTPWKSRLIPGVRAKQVSVAETHACAVDESGKVYCWGSNRWGELCDGSRMDRTSPVPAMGVSDAVMVSVENSVTCIVRRSGEVGCCGKQRRRW